jgi:hypothetical protein
MRWRADWITHQCCLDISEMKTLAIIGGNAFSLFCCESGWIAFAGIVVLAFDLAVQIDRLTR